MRSKVIQKAMAQLAQQLTINKDEMHHQMLTSVEKTRREALEETEANLSALGNPLNPLSLRFFFFLSYLW